MKRKKKRSPPSKLKSLEKPLSELWRKLVYARAGYKCEWCGRTMTLNAHHIARKKSCRERWSLDNGMALCVDCHINRWHGQSRGEAWMKSTKQGTARWNKAQALKKIPYNKTKELQRREDLLVEFLQMAEEMQVII